MIYYDVSHERCCLTGVKRFQIIILAPVLIGKKRRNSVFCLSLGSVVGLYILWSRLNATTDELSCKVYGSIFNREPKSGGDLTLSHLYYTGSTFPLPMSTSQRILHNALMRPSGKLLAIGFASTMRLSSNYFDLLFAMVRRPS